MITINNDIVNIAEEYTELNDVLRHIVEMYGEDSRIARAAIFRMLADDALYTENVNTVIRKSGEWMVNRVLTARLGDDKAVVIDGNIIAAKDNAADLADFIEVVETTFGSQDPIEWLLGGSGSCLNFDADGCVIYVGADVPEDAKVFVMYHEYRHFLDYVENGMARPRLAHASARSSRVEKECDLYALRRLIEKDDGLPAVEAAIEWMIRSHFRWEIDHPLSVSDLLHRAVQLYRVVREEFHLDPEVSNDIKTLIESYKE